MGVNQIKGDDKERGKIKKYVEMYKKCSWINTQVFMGWGWHATVLHESLKQAHSSFLREASWDSLCKIMAAGSPTARCVSACGEWEWQ